MPDATLEPALHRDLESLRSHVDSQFEGVKEWIRVVSQALERLTDQRDRIIVLEQESKNQAQKLSDQQLAIKGVETVQAESKSKVQTILIWGSVVMGLGGFVIIALQTYALMKGL